MNNPSLIPNNPERRKVIMVLSNQKFNSLRIEDDNGLRANPNVCLVNYDSITSDYGILERIKPLISPNIVLIQSPYNSDIYELSDDAIYKFSLSKHVIASQLFRLLGCRELEVIQLDIQGEIETRQFNLKENHPLIETGIQSLSVNEKSLLSEVTLKEVYKGSKPRIQEAEDYLAKHYLTNEINLMGLVEKCRDNDNKLCEYNLKVNLTQESKSTLDFLVNLSIPSYFVEVNTKISTIKQHKTQYKVTYKALF